MSCPIRRSGGSTTRRLENLKEGPSPAASAEVDLAAPVLTQRENIGLDVLASMASS